MGGTWRVTLQRAGRRGARVERERVDGSISKRRILLAMTLPLIL